MNSYYLLFIMAIILALFIIIYQKIDESNDIELSKKLIQFYIALLVIKMILLFIFTSRGMTMCYLGKTVFC